MSDSTPIPSSTVNQRSRRTRHPFALFVILLFALLTSHAWANGCTLTGDGSINTPFQIASSADLVYLSNTEACITGGYHFKQTANIDFQGVTWNSGIGSDGDVNGTSVDAFFQGTYDGGNFSLSNLNISSSHGVVGLFDRTEDATIRNLKLVNVTVSTSDQRAGSLIGRADETTVISNVDVQATVSGRYDIGGLIGYAEDSSAVSVTNTTFTGSVTAENANGTSRVGGVIGDAGGDVTITFTTIENANILLNGSDANDTSLGGLIGEAGSTTVTIKHVTVSNTTVSAHDLSLATGGFIGDADGTNVTVEHASFDGTVNGGEKVGGVVGDVGSFVGREITVTAAVVAASDDAPADAGGLLGEVSNVTITDVHVTANITATDLDNVGGIVGEVRTGGTVSATTFSGAIIGGEIVGGLIGEAEEVHVAQSSSSGSVEGTLKVGGAIGHAKENVTVEHVHVQGDVTGTSDVGGLIGQADTSGLILYTSHKQGTVQGGERVGGLVGNLAGFSSEGLNGTRLGQSFASGTVIGTDQVGGLIGVAKVGDYLQYAYASASVKGANDVGGLIGKFANGYVQYVYATGKAEATNTNAGGLIGVIDGGAFLYHAYAAGEVTGPAGETGGLVGKKSSGNANPSGSFWDVSTTNQEETVGRGTGLSTDDMRTFSTYEDAGWDIVTEATPDQFDASGEGGNTIWVLCNGGVATGYPQLVWQEDDRPTCGAASNQPGFTLSTTDGTSLLRNVPFTLTINLQDESGDPLTATQDVELTLTATGGSTEGDLRKVGSLDEDVTVTLPTGASSISITDLIYTGLSDPNSGLDITITATSNGTYPDATLAISVRDITMTITADADNLPSNGTTPILVTLKDAQGNAVPGTNITITTTLGTLLNQNGDPLTNPVTLATDENGEIRLTFQAGTEFGAATISVQCPGACTRTTTIQIASTEITAPTDLTVIPGNQKIWLLFTKSQGTVAKYQYQLDDGPWTDIPADVQLPYLIAERPNGVQVTVTVRAIDQNGDPSAQSNASTGTPTIIGEPDAALGIQDDDTIIEIPLQNGKGLLTMTFTFRNEGTETLTNMWIEENDLSPKGRIIELKDTQGNTLPQYGDRWYWQGVNLAPGATIQGTLTMEIEE